MNREEARKYVLKKLEDPLYSRVYRASCYEDYKSRREQVRRSCGYETWNEFLKCLEICEYKP